MSSSAALALELLRKRKDRGDLEMKAPKLRRRAFRSLETSADPGMEEFNALVINVEQFLGNFGRFGSYEFNERNIGSREELLVSLRRIAAMGEGVDMFLLLNLRCRCERIEEEEFEEVLSVFSKKLVNEAFDCLEKNLRRRKLIVALSLMQSVDLVTKAEGNVYLDWLEKSIFSRFRMNVHENDENIVKDVVDLWSSKEVDVCLKFRRIHAKLLRKKKFLPLQKKHEVVEAIAFLQSSIKGIDMVLDSQPDEEGRLKLRLYSDGLCDSGRKFFNFLICSGSRLGRSIDELISLNPKFLRHCVIPGLLFFEGGNKGIGEENFRDQCASLCQRLAERGVIKRGFLRFFTSMKSRVVADILKGALRGKESKPNLIAEFVRKLNEEKDLTKEEMKLVFVEAMESGVRANVKLAKVFLSVGWLWKFSKMKRILAQVHFTWPDFLLTLHSQAAKALEFESNRTELIHVLVLLTCWPRQAEALRDQLSNMFGAKLCERIWHDKEKSEDKKKSAPISLIDLVNESFRGRTGSPIEPPPVVTLKMLFWMQKRVPPAERAPDSTILDFTRNLSDATLQRGVQFPELQTWIVWESIAFRQHPIPAKRAVSWLQHCREEFFPGIQPDDFNAALQASSSSSFVIAAEFLLAFPMPS